METQNHYSPMKQEMTKEEFRVIWQSIHLKATDEYAIPPEIIRVNGSTIGTLGNFSASAEDLQCLSHCGGCTDQHRGALLCGIIPGR